jgi:hypothetical protein
MSYRFWEKILPLIKEQTPCFKNRSPTRDPWLLAGSGVGGLYYRMYFSSKICATGFEFNSRDWEKNLRYFDAFLSRKEEIESALGVELVWERHEDQRLSMINVVRTDLHLDREDDWDEAIRFILNWHKQVYAVFQPILESV